MEFRPPPVLRSPHLQTLLSSRLVHRADGVGSEPVDRAETVTLTGRDGIRLRALVNAAADPSAPLVVLIHGWLGRADSPYVRRVSTALHEAGFAVARLLLRDHGDTAHLNEEMFNAARIDEVADACNALAARFAPVPAGIVGFSLGGNFALRLAAHPDLDGAFRSALAVCPVLDPESSVRELDHGWAAYRLYFLGKWRRAFAAKQAVFPDRYDFADARRLSLVSTLTDYFVSRHTPFRDARDYYGHYTLTPDFLGRFRMPVRILATEDDPVLPAEHARRLLSAAGGEVVTLVPHGGHCGFIESWQLRSALDDYAVEFFSSSR